MPVLRFSAFEGRPPPSAMSAVGEDALIGLLEGTRILVVEDEVVIGADLRDALVSAGADVTYARTAQRALKALDHLDDLDIAVLDVSLGPRDTCEPVANVLRTRGVPFLLHSGDLDRRGEVIERLGAPVLHKPSRADEVVRRLAAMLG